MRTLLFQGYMWGYILSKANKTFTINRLNKAGKNKEKVELIDQFILKCTKKLVKISGADVTVTGTENVPLDEPVLYVGNHQGIWIFHFYIQQLLKRWRLLLKRKWRRFLYWVIG